MDEYPCVKITEADCKRAQARSAGSWGDETWVDDRQRGSRGSLRWNGLLAEVVTLRYLGYPEIGGWDNGIDICGPWGTAQVKFRSANHYGLSRPAAVRHVKADYILLVVPGCEYLNHKILRQDDEICIAGWISRDDFRLRSQPQVFFGKQHHFVDQPLAPMSTWPGRLA